MINLYAFLPEAILVASACLLLLMDLFPGAEKRKGWLNWVAGAGVLTATASLACVGGWCPGFCSSGPGSLPVSSFGGFLSTDAMALFFKAVVLLSTLLTLVLSFRYFKGRSTPYPAEFLALLLFSSAGASALASAQEIVTLFISLETLTISSYLLASFMKKDKGSNEAGMKYLLLGAFSSAVMLLGFSYLFGLTGTTVIRKMGEAFSVMPSSPLAVLAVILVIGGLAFKISLAPFHMWTPDVYEGAPTPITAYLSVASKTAGFAAFVRLFWEGLAVPSLQPTWVALFALLAALSIVLGNLIAIPQSNIKRMMAYSSIAQAGYLAIGFLAGNAMGLTALLFYSFVYLFANMGAFLAIVIVAERTGSEQIEDYAGLWKRSPLLGVVLLVCLLSLAGVPPFAGFSGKWYLFGAAISQGYTWLALLGMGFSVVSLFYYLQVAKKALVPDPKEDTPIPVGFLEKIVLLICVVVTVLFGFWPTPLMDLAQAAASSLFNF